MASLDRGDSTARGSDGETVVGAESLRTIAASTQKRSSDPAVPLVKKRCFPSGETIGVDSLVTMLTAGPRLTGWPHAPSALRTLM